MVLHSHRTHYAFSFRDNTTTIIDGLQHSDYRAYNLAMQYSEIFLEIANDGSVATVLKARYSQELTGDLLSHLFTEKELTIMRLGAIPSSIKLLVDKHL